MGGRDRKLDDEFNHCSELVENIFYNRSFFDGNDAAINANDDLAIATNKQALLQAKLLLQQLHQLLAWH